MAARRRAATSSTARPALAAPAASVLRSRSVSKAPGSRLLIVTLAAASRGCRARPATKPVSPERAPLDSPSTSMGAFTAPEVMLTTRPKPRAAIASTVAWISSMGASMLASSAAIHCARSQSRKSPGGGPPALLMRMSTCGQAASAAARPCGVAMSPATARTSTAGFSARSAAAVACRSASPRAVMTTWAPSPTSASAQPRPSPLLAAHTRAQRPFNPRSMSAPPAARHAGLHHRAARADPALPGRRKLPLAWAAGAGTGWAISARTCHPAR
mmetsp:Transcript_41080/g.114270  ORF Transcript_41080/g.114270 Transcript_41080/m.114270 type:complete len:272 (-) Transcript_41080:830-1645(-)